MKFKKEYALLGVVILVLLIYLFRNQQDQVHYALPETPRLNAADIDQLTVTKAGETITLKRQDDQWRLTPGDYPADTAQVERMLKSVAELEITALVSEAQSYPRYELDADRRIEVKLFAESQLIRQVAIGKAASTFRHTHVLVDDDKNVYHAGGSFRWEFDKSIDDLRDKTVLSFDRGAITSIAIKADAPEQVIRKEAVTDRDAAPDATPTEKKLADAPPDVKWVTAEGQTVENTAVDELLEALSPLKCKAFIDENQKASLGDPQYRIQLTGESNHHLEIFSPRPETPNEFPGTSSGSPYAFELSEFDMEKIKRFYGQITGTDDNAAAPEPATEP
jgi:hypothetical protein